MHTNSFLKLSVKAVLSVLLIISFSTSLKARFFSTSDTCYRIAEITDSFNVSNVKKVIYKHLFTYDKKGRPLSHTWNYYRNDKLYSTSTMKYSYDEAGRLISKKSDKVNYKYFYDANFSLIRIELYLFVNSKWDLYEETLLEENRKLGDSNKTVTLTLYKRKNTADTLNVYSNIEYIVDRSNNVIKSTVRRYGYSNLGSPHIYTYHYDNKPNPLQHIFIQRWYEFDVENGGLTNLLDKSRGEKVMYKRVYEYDPNGYPVKYSTGGRTLKFKYAQLITALQKTIENRSKGEEKASLLLYPNPATTELTVKAGKLGEGEAILELYNINGIVYKLVKYYVTDNLEALIPLNGVPKGTYIIEIRGTKSTISKTLVVQY